MTTKMKKTQQLYFYLDSTELVSFKNFLIEQGYLFLNRYSETSNMEVLLSLNASLAVDYIAIPETLKEIKFNKISDHQFSLDFSVSPVIEFNQPVQRVNEISRGRLYVLHGYDGRDSWIQYPDVLTSSYRNIVKHLKETYLTKEIYLGGYVSKCSKVHAENGGKLVQF